MSKEQCGHCGRSFARLGQHFFHNPDCSAFASKRAGTKQMCVTSEEYEIVENSTDEESAEDDSPFLARMDDAPVVFFFFFFFFSDRTSADTSSKSSFLGKY